MDKIPLRFIKDPIMHIIYTCDWKLIKKIIIEDEFTANL